MSRLLTIFVLTLFVQGCVTQSKCDRKFPVTGKDSTYTKIDTVTIHDTIPFPYEVITLDTNGLFPENITFHSEQEKGGLKSTVSISKGNLKVKCEADSLKAIIKRKDLIISTFNQKKETKWLPCDKTHRTPLDTSCRYFTGISLLLLLIIFIAWLTKKYFKPF